MSVQEFERLPVAPEKLESAKYFAASYAGEHVAGTEFVIGAMFVAWGIGTQDILFGLLIGNLLAVLTWGLVCAPIAVDTRLTLYAYLEKMAGPKMVKIFSVVNGVLFCVLAGAMITVSASAVRILFDLEPQVNWYPTSMGFVAVALVVGAIVVWIAAKGFKGVAQFAEVSSPWMILMFFVGAFAVIPSLVAATPGLDGLTFVQQFYLLADTHVWKDTGSELGMWHVAAFSWVCNLAMHGGMADMTILRFAKKARYGYFSGLGMFIGHFLAWICAGFMGAAAALLLKVSVTSLDAGAVAYQVLGVAGIIAVIIAGWTTSNPTIYRAGLAFQSIQPKWNRTRVTIVTGVVTTIIACFPFVFTKLMDFVSLMGLVMSPVGAIIFAEHWLLPKLGMVRYWSRYKKQLMNKAALTAWFGSLLIAYLLFASGMHIFFLAIPTWFVAAALYIGLSSVMGARQNYGAEAQTEQEQEEQRQKAERLYLQQENRVQQQSGKSDESIIQGVCNKLTLLSLLACLVLSLLAAFNRMSLADFQQWLMLPTIVYFVVAVLSVLEKRRTDQLIAQKGE